MDQVQEHFVLIAITKVSSSKLYLSSWRIWWIKPAVILVLKGLTLLPKSFWRVTFMQQVHWHWSNKISNY